jgi:hypothetical protein
MTTYTVQTSKLIVVNMKRWVFPRTKTTSVRHVGFGLFDLSKFAFVSFDGAKPYVLAQKKHMVEMVKGINSLPGYVERNDYYPVD